MRLRLALGARGGFLMVLQEDKGPREDEGSSPVSQ